MMDKIEKLKEVKSASDFIEMFNIDISSTPIEMQPILNDLGISLKMGDLNLNNEEISGAIKKDSNGAMILVNIKDCYTRRRFTIAHELAHYIFEMIQGNEQTILETRSYIHAGVAKEFRADNFAAELLMPENLVRLEYKKMFIPTAEQLAKKFEVSKIAMKKRLKGMGLFTLD